MGCRQGGWQGPEVWAQSQGLCTLNLVTCWDSETTEADVEGVETVVLTKIVYSREWVEGPVEGHAKHEQQGSERLRDGE